MQLETGKLLKIVWNSLVRNKPGESSNLSEFIIHIVFVRMARGPGKTVWVLGSAVSCFHAFGFWVLWFWLCVSFPAPSSPPPPSDLQWFSCLLSFLSTSVFLLACFFKTLISLASEQKTRELLNRITLKWWFNWPLTHD